MTASCFLFQTLNALPDWAPVYYDSSHVVYLRTGPQTQALVDRLRIDWKKPCATRRAAAARADANRLARQSLAQDG